jgi:heme/copper-type cytochrome/quinol oxidase subunit 2
MKSLLDKRGVALVMVLVIISISTVMIGVLLYFIQRGTEISGLEKKYEIAKEASLGAVEVLTKEIIPLAIIAATTSPSSSLTTALGNFNTITNATITAIATNACFSNKLLYSTAIWDAIGSCPPNCCNCCSSTSDPKTSPDIKFTLSGVSPALPFDVFTKIVDTVSGNTDTSGITLEGIGVAESSGAVISAQHFPYMYRIEVQGERQNNPSERANFEVLYAY